MCRLGILKGVCEDGKLVCKFYRGERVTDYCWLYLYLNEKYMADRELSAFNIFLGGVLKKD